MDRLRLWMMVCWTGWILTFGQSFASYFRGGEMAVTGLLGWQAVAGLMAIPILVLGRHWPPGTSVRLLSHAPIGLATLALIAVLMALRR